MNETLKQLMESKNYVGEEQIKLLYGAGLISIKYALILYFIQACRKPPFYKNTKSIANILGVGDRLDLVRAEIYRLRKSGLLLRDGHNGQRKREWRIDMSWRPTETNVIVTNVIVTNDTPTETNVTVPTETNVTVSTETNVTTHRVIDIESKSKDSNSLSQIATGSTESTQKALNPKQIRSQIRDELNRRITGEERTAKYISAYRLVCLYLDLLAYIGIPNSIIRDMRGSDERNDGRKSWMQVAQESADRIITAHPGVDGLKYILSGMVDYFYGLTIPNRKKIEHRAMSRPDMYYTCFEQFLKNHDPKEIERKKREEIRQQKIEIRDQERAQRLKELYYVPQQ